jgi:hypothetical protein
VWTISSPKVALRGRTTALGVVEPHGGVLVVVLAEAFGADHYGGMDDLEPEDNDRATTWIGSLALLALATGTVVYHSLEDWTWVDSFYFSVVALTTVGFGDLAPSTDTSKLFTIVFILGGVSLIGAALNQVMKRQARRSSERRSRHQ